MKTLVLSFILLVAAAFAFASPPPKAATETPKAGPVAKTISAELRAKLWRRVAEVSSAQATLTSAQAALTEVQQEVSTACDGNVIGKPDGEPDCAPPAPVAGAAPAATSPPPAAKPK